MNFDQTGKSQKAANQNKTIQQKPNSLFNKSFYQFLFSFVGVIAAVLVVVLVLGVQVG
jgi:hypothetical protein